MWSIKFGEQPTSRDQCEEGCAPLAEKQLFIKPAI